MVRILATRVLSSCLHCALHTNTLLNRSHPFGTLHVTQTCDKVLKDA